MIPSLNDNDYFHQKMKAILFLQVKAFLEHYLHIELWYLSVDNNTIYSHLSTNIASGYKKSTSKKPG